MTMARRFTASLAFVALMISNPVFAAPAPPFDTGSPETVAAQTLPATSPAPQSLGLPPPPIDCVVGPFIVFFDWNKAKITADSAATLDNAIEGIHNCPSFDPWQLMLAGFTDRSGSVGSNLALAHRRAAAVRSYFRHHGLAGKIVIQTFGKDFGHLRVATPDNRPEPQNRRVEITLQPIF